MNFIFGIFDKVTGFCQRVFDNNNRSAINKRKRSSSDFNENISPNKRLKIFHTQTQTEYFPRASFGIFTSRAEKMQSMTNVKSSYLPSVKTALRPPQSWNLNMENDAIEFSSDDDDDDNNDVQVIGEEPPRNRNPLTLLPLENGSSAKAQDENGVQVLKVLKKGKGVKPSGPQEMLPLRTSTPSSVTTSQRKSGGRLSGILNMKKNSSLSVIKGHSFEKQRVPTLNMTIQMESKEKYSALIRSFLGNSSLSTASTSSFANLQDVEKKFETHSCGSFKLKPRKCSTENVKIIDLTKPRDKRKPFHVTVKPAPSKPPDDDDSDIEIVSVKPVPRVNSFEQKLSRSSYTVPEWIENLQISWNNVNEETARKCREQKIKKDLYAKRNQEQLDAVEERVRRYMSITDTIVLDEQIEELEDKLPELTPEMEERIAAALVLKPGTEVIAEGFSLRITRKDMHTLARLNWLNDEVINFYMNLLIERGKRDKMPKVYAFNTFFYPTVTSRGHASVRRWTRKIDVFAQDLIVVPVHLGVHWCVAIIDFREKVIEYYDSMGHPNDKCLQALLKYLEAESLDKKNSSYDTSSWKLKTMTDIPQQMNGSDCGMFACTFAEYKCRNAKITFTQEDMPYFRRKMVYEILTGRLMISND